MSVTTYVKSNPIETIAIVGVAAAILYVATKGSGAGNTKTPLDYVGNALGGGLGQIGSGLASLPGNIVITAGKKAVTTSEAKTSTETFGDVPYSNVSGFLATGAKKGDVFAQPVTYNQFIQAQPLAFRGAAAAGNIITNNEAANYGGFVASETKKAVPNASAKFAQLPAWNQALVGLGQAFTVPFGGGGAAGWASSLFGGK